MGRRARPRRARRGHDRQPRRGRRHRAGSRPEKPEKEEDCHIEKESNDLVGMSPSIVDHDLEAVDRSLHVRQDAILLGVVGVSIAVGVWLVSPFLLPLVLKGNYIGAIGVVRIVIFALPLILLSSIFLNLLYIDIRKYNDIKILNVFFI